MTYTEQYAPYIRKIVGAMYKKRSGYYEFNELLSIAMLASIEAERRYNPELATFSTYIKRRVEGALTSFITNLDSGSLKTLKDILKFIKHYQAEHGLTPSLNIISDGVKAPVEKLIRILANANINIVSYDATSTDLFDDDNTLELEVAELLDALPPEHSAVLRNFMYDEATDPAELEVALSYARKHYKVNI